MRPVRSVLDRADRLGLGQVERLVGAHALAGWEELTEELARA